MTEIAERVAASIDLTSAPLRDVENYIAPRLRGFVEAGFALLAVRERRLYLQGGFDTFDAYCRVRWGIEERHARHMCDAAQVAHITAGSTGGTAVQTVENEAQARELAPLLGKPDQLIDVWQRTVERAEQTGVLVTGPLIRQVRREHERLQASPQPRPAPAPRVTPPPARPVPVVIPPDANRMFGLLTQAAEEARSLGGADLVRVNGIPASVLSAWAAGYDDVAALCTALAGACRDQA